METEKKLKSKKLSDIDFNVKFNQNRIFDLFDETHELKDRINLIDAKLDLINARGDRDSAELDLIDARLEYAGLKKESLLDFIINTLFHLVLMTLACVIANALMFF